MDGRRGMGQSIPFGAMKITATTIESGQLPAGIYIARLVTPEYSQSIKMLLLK